MYKMISFINSEIFLFTNIEEVTYLKLSFSKILL